jgi:hypothetical protein
MSEIETPSGRMKNMSEILKNIVVSVAVITGGIWTLFTFKSLGQEQQARASLAKVQAETTAADAQRRESELKVRDFPLQIEVSAKSAKINRRRQLAVVAILRNPGAGPLLLTFREPVFRLARVVSGTTGLTASPVAEGSAIYLSSNGTAEVADRRLLGQQSRRLPYLFNVSEPGDYLLQIGVDYRDESASKNNTFAFEQEIVHVE